VVGRELVQGAGLVVQGAADTLEEAADVAVGVVGGDAVAGDPRGERGEVGVR
jgi:hypothetical protein